MGIMVAVLKYTVSVDTDCDVLSAYLESRIN